MDNLTPEQRKKNMQSIRSVDSKAEMILRKELWSRGYRYRKNYSKVIGKPDIAFVGKKVAIFCDGEFWHGYYYAENIDTTDENKDYWNKKIKRNIDRDKRVNSELESYGWIVLRFWTKDIFKDLEGCINKITDALNRRN